MIGERVWQRFQTAMPSAAQSDAAGTSALGVRISLNALILGLTALLILSLTIAVTIGPVSIAPLTVWQIAFAQTFDIGSGDWSKAQEQIVWFIRLPRVLLAAIVGAGLAVVGVAMQATVRNPIADPYILGISSGASVGAVLAILFGLFGIFGLYSLSVAAFLGALVSFTIVFAIAHRGGHITPMRLILAGIAVAYVFQAITSFLIFRSPDREGIRSVLFWLMGSVAGAKWEILTIPATVLIVGTVFLILQARPMNSLLAGDEAAVTLGVDTDRFRRQLLVITALVTGVMVAISGAIGFVGLMMPHFVRLLVGSDHRRVLPVSALSGAIFLIWVDVLARTVVQPEELPIGIITAFIGAPIFLWLMHRRAGAFGGGG